jgi:hypothetical protein
VLWFLAAFALAVVVLAVMALEGTFGPGSLRAQFKSASRRRGPEPEPTTIGEKDLAVLPAPVARYLRVAGVVGRPRVRDYTVRFSGRIRRGADAPWMPFTAEQHSVVSAPTRLFLMRARMRGLPVEAFHRYQGGLASMKVVLAGLVPIANAAGPVLDMSETVTVLNDMALLAPATLLDPRITWAAIDDRSVRASFDVAGHIVSATLFFDESGLLSNFVSDDRSRASDDGRSFTKMRFSTPVGEFRNFDGMTLPSYGEARWHAPEGAFTYGEFHVTAVAYNRAQPPAIAPTTSRGSLPSATAAGSLVSGGSWERSSSHAK